MKVFDEWDYNGIMGHIENSVDVLPQRLRLTLKLFPESFLYWILAAVSLLLSVGYFTRILGEESEKKVKRERLTKIRSVSSFL